MADARTQLQDAFAQIMDLAKEFAAASQQALAGSLSSATERFVASNADVFNAMDEETTRALRRAVDDTIEGSAEAIARALREPEIWLHPYGVPERREEWSERRWGDDSFFTHVVRIARRVTDPPPDVEVDNPFNRVWIQLSNGADRLDGVLNEFGFRPSNHPDVGGAHFGLQPQTIEELDPSGTLVRLWNRFVKLHARYRELERAAGAATTSEANEEALRRWRAAAEE